jgi:hypothetical protein
MAATSPAASQNGWCAITCDSSDTNPVRTSEQLDWDALARYAREKLAAELGDRFDATADMIVEQFPGGHSNLTYLLRFGDQEFVMRRPPFGPVPPKAHDMARECRILAAVTQSFRWRLDRTYFAKTRALSVRPFTSWSAGTVWSCAMTSRPNSRTNPKRAAG